MVQPCTSCRTRSSRWWLVDEGELLPLRNQAVEVAKFDPDLVVFDPRCKQVHLLERVTAVVFEACDGITTRQQLLAAMAAAQEFSVQDADLRVRKALAKLARLGLLQDTEYQVQPP